MFSIPSKLTTSSKVLSGIKENKEKLCLVNKYFKNLVGDLRGNEYCKKLRGRFEGEMNITRNERKI